MGRANASKWGERRRLSRIGHPPCWSLSMSTSRSLTDHFATLDDPRIERTKLHPLLNIVTIALCAVIAGAESWDDIEDFGVIRADWFAIPSGSPRFARPTEAWICP